MKLPQTPSPNDSQNSQSFSGRILLAGAKQMFNCATIFLAMTLLAMSSASAQGIRFQFQQVRVTVPVNSTTTSVISNSPPTNNTVVLVNGATNANFDISGLPAGASAVLTDTNGNPLTSITDSTNVVITLNTINIPEGIYNFSLNASGLDTNGLPVTNSFPFVLQSAHIWKGGGLGTAGFGVSNNWANAASWQGGNLPTATSDVIFGDSGAQTNAAVTNIGVDVNTTIASMRFAQTAYTNDTVTNGLSYTIKIGANATLAVTGTNGFSLMRDYVGEFGYSPDSSMTVNFINTNSGTLLVSNANANFGILVGSQINPTLNFSNLATVVTYVNRMGLSDYQIYPNYRALNEGYNGGRDATNYAGLPRRFWNTVLMAKTNFITALYHDPDNYTNEFTRAYGLMVQNNEQSGNGSSVNTFFLLGSSNVINADSVCLVGSSSASGNTGGVKFQKPGSGAIFRGTNGGRMSILSISDDGGTNQASSNVKSTIDFSGPTNSISILADRFYIARDRTMITSNQTPNVQGDFTMGAGTVDVNTAILGFQEHSNKVDWTTIGGAQPYLNYCQGRLVVTNSGAAVNLGGTFKVNGNLTLGYTADRNPGGSAQQYNTFGRITIYTNATVIASNIICDGGLNYYDSNGRQNTITINQGGTLVVSNTLGSANSGGPGPDFLAADPNGIRLDNLTIAGGKLTLQIDPSRTNVFVRTLATPGLAPGIIKVASLTGVTSFPAQIPVISYVGTATPFLNADVSALGTNYFGYILNNAANQTVDLYITTNAPNNLVWTGATGNNTWDTTSFNWVPAGGGAATNFNLGDLVTFDDSSSFNSIGISDSVVPGQTGAGVTISNTVKQYTFSGGTIAGTALVVKQGTNSVEFDSTAQGPIAITAGSVTGSGAFGAVTVSSNALLNFSGSINGGLTSTGAVYYTGTSFNGPVSIQGGFLDNRGTINTTFSQVVTMAPGTILTNEAAGVINLGSGPGQQNSFTWDVPAGSMLVNYGNINLFQPKISVEGVLFGNGTINDPNGGGLESIAANGNAGRLLINQTGVMGVGPTLQGTVSTMNVQCRFDFNNDPTASALPGISTILLDFDFANAQINDIINCDRWNNDTGLLLFTNINPTAGTFTNGQVFTILNNTSGSGTNNHVDTVGFSPFIQPYVPGPNLVWGTTNFNTFGKISVTTNSLIWDGVSSANWSTNVASDTSWKAGQTFTPNMGSFFGDNANGSSTVNITTLVMPAGERGTVLNSNQPSVFPGITVSNATKDYVFTGNGKITGMTGIYKTGPGTLFLLTTNANDFSGNVIIDNGTIAVTNLPGGLTGGQNIVSLGSAGSGQMKNDLVLDGGTLAYIGTTNVNLNHFPLLMSRNGTVSVSSATNMLTLDRIVSGVGSLIKTGPGTLALTQGGDAYGDTIVNSGTLRLAGAAAGVGAITMANSTTLEFTNIFTLTNALNFPVGAVSINVLPLATNVISGPWSGGAVVTFSNQTPTAPFVFNGSLSNFSGTLSFGATSANYRFNNGTNKNDCTGSALASFDLGTGANTLSNLNGAGLTYDLGALLGGANTILAGRSSNSLVTAGTTYSIGANGANTAFAGRIMDGLDTVKVVKVGTGRLLLNGNNTYTGSTTVSNGVLGGSGSIASPLTIAPVGTLNPGATVGTFTVSNTVALNGTVVMELNGASSDQLAATGTITGGGSLVITNVGPDIANNTVFHLFNKAVSGFASKLFPTNNPANTSTYTWQDNLAVDGTIKLLTGGSSGVNTNPTNINVSVTGNVMTLSWPPDYLGYQLLSNSVGLLATNQWYPISGSTTVTQENLTLDISKTNVFFRIVYPPQP
jgi:autotransporter-associated beta strand protein